MINRDLDHDLEDHFFGSDQDLILIYDQFPRGDLDRDLDHFVRDLLTHCIQVKYTK